MIFTESKNLVLFRINIELIWFRIDWFGLALIEVLISAGCIDIAGKRDCQNGCEWQLPDYTFADPEIDIYVRDNSCKKIINEEAFLPFYQLTNGTRRPQVKHGDRRIVDACVCNDGNYCNAASPIKLFGIIPALMTIFSSLKC